MAPVLPVSTVADAQDWQEMLNSHRRPYVPDKCNGHRELLHRRYSDVTYAATHNSYAKGGWFNLAANQRTSITEQLQNGIRALNFYVVPHCCWFCDVALFLGVRTSCHALASDEQSLVNQAEPHFRVIPRHWRRHSPVLSMCHTTCALQNSGPLQDGLAELATFLDAPENRDEVATVLIQNNFAATRSQLYEIAQRSKLLPYLHPHSSHEPFPELFDMITQNQRVFFFASSIGAPRGYNDSNLYDSANVILNYDDFISETPWKLRTPRDWTCELDRPSGIQRDLLLINHWLYFNIFDIDMPSERIARKVNRSEVILAHVRKCEQLRQHRVNFIKIDFYEVSNIQEVIAELNGAISVNTIPNRENASLSDDSIEHTY